MTKKIDEILSSDQMALKSIETKTWFGNYQNELGSRILSDGNLKSDYLVKNFDSGLIRQPEVRRQLREISGIQNDQKKGLSPKKQPSPKKIHE